MKTKNTRQTIATSTKRYAVIAFAAIFLMMLAACGTEAPPVEPAPLPADVSELPEHIDKDSVEAQSVSTDDAQDIGQGSTVFRLEVTDDTDMVTAWNVHTDEATVGDALVAVGLIDNAEYFIEVNGIVADFDADEAWWAFFIDGEMAMEGVGTTNIEPDVTYSIVYTIGWG